MTIPRPKLLKIFFGLGLLYSFYAKKILFSCTKTILQRNQTDGVLTVGFRIWFFYALYIQKEQIAGPQNDHATRKSSGNIVCVTALVLILCKDHTLPRCTK
jgi:hypothetical protein